ncbi:MAG: PAS domain S-box protein, partial [Bacteriovoracaceae bacterium]
MPNQNLFSKAENFRLLVETVKDYGIFMLDPQGNIKTWNEGAKNIKGYNHNEIVGKHFSIFYPEEDIKAGKPEYELKEAIKVGRFEDEGWRIRKDGSRFWANVIITALKKDNELLGFSKVTRDLSERKKLENELRDTQNALKVLLEETQQRLSIALY